MSWFNFGWQNKDVVGTIRLNWGGGEMTQDILRVFRRRLRLVGEILKIRIQQSLGNSAAGGASLPGQSPNLQTGRLRNSIFSDTDTSAMITRVGTNLKYGLWMEFGTSGGQTIVPKRASMLRFKGKGGQWVFARKVTRGAVAARPFLRSTFVRETPTIRKIMEAKIPRLRGAGG